MRRAGRVVRCAAALAVCGSLAACSQAQATQGAGSQELLAALSAVRARGCGDQPAGGSGLRRVAALEEAARRIARGTPAADATRAAGYRAKTLFRVQLSGYRSVGDVAQAMARQYCKPLTDPALTDLGMHREGNAYWVLLAEPFSPPPPAAAGDVAARILALTNEARSQPRKCGNRLLAAAAPVKHNVLLERAAAAHAGDMARHGQLRHEGSDGSDAGERASRAGYRWRSIGENVASGQTSPDQVMREWLGSPGHCATLMGPDFTEMGVAYAANMNSEGGVYWAQEFGRPR